MTYPHATHVSRVLAKDGFARSVRETTRVRGYGRTTRGFKVETGGLSVFVSWYTGLNVHEYAHAEQQRTQIEAMADTLRKARYVVEVKAFPKSFTDKYLMVVTDREEA